MLMTCVPFTCTQICHDNKLVVDLIQMKLFKNLISRLLSLPPSKNEREPGIKIILSKSAVTIILAIIKLSERTLSYADSSTYCRLYETPFELYLIQTLYLHIPVSGQLQLGTLFLLPRVSTYGSFNCINLEVKYGFFFQAGSFFM